MIPAKSGQITFIFFVSIGMSCVVSSALVLNTTRFVITFFGLWMTDWLKIWIVAFRSLIVIAQLERHFVDKLLME